MSKFSRGFLNAATAVSGLELDDSLISAAELYNTDSYFFLIMNMIYFRLKNLLTVYPDMKFNDQNCQLKVMCWSNFCCCWSYVLKYLPTLSKFLNLKLFKIIGRRNSIMNMDGNLESLFPVVKNEYTINIHCLCKCVKIKSIKSTLVYQI